MVWGAEFINDADRLSISFAQRRMSFSHKITGTIPNQGPGGTQAGLLTRDQHSLSLGVYTAGRPPIIFFTPGAGENAYIPVRLRYVSGEWRTTLVSSKYWTNLSPTPFELYIFIDKTGEATSGQMGIELLNSSGQVYFSSDDEPPIASQLAPVNLSFTWQSAPQQESKWVVPDVSFSLNSRLAGGKVAINATAFFFGTSGGHPEEFGASTYESVGVARRSGDTLTFSLSMFAYPFIAGSSGVYMGAPYWTSAMVAILDPTHLDEI